MFLSRCRLLLLSTSVALLPMQGQSLPVNAGLPRAYSIPSITKHGERYALMVDGAPILELGGQINNSSAWADSMPLVWPTIESLHANTMEAPVYWESLEPKPDTFDFAQVDMLLDQSRQHQVRLVLLWFGTWKNGSGHYIPQWMKLDEKRYPHVLSATGTPVDSLSPHSDATLAADKRAFAALMRHLKQSDPQHTVIMVQVENEPGTWGAVRDHSAVAERLFAEPVPATVLRSTGATTTGSWREVYGAQADGFFQAWAVATYIDQVAAAGKAEYPLPMYVNVALRDPLNPGRQGSWESGGATDDVLGLWRGAAPHIDLLAPDIYTGESAKYLKVLSLYARPDNPLLVPETGRGPAFARYCFAAIGDGALGWAPFGLDATSQYTPALGASGGASRLSEEALVQFRYNFAVLSLMDRQLAELSLQGKVHGFAESDGPAPHDDHYTMGDWKVEVTYGRPHFGESRGTGANTPAQGEALVAQLSPGQFLVAGYSSRVQFQPTGGLQGRHRQFLAVEEGRFEAGKWVTTRIWNGDQTDYGLNFASSPVLLRVSLATY
jgi:beta-galactosidase GanA